MHTVKTQEALYRQVQKKIINMQLRERITSIVTNPQETGREGTESTFKATKGDNYHYINKPAVKSRWLELLHQTKSQTLRQRQNLSTKYGINCIEFCTQEHRLDGSNDGVKLEPNGKSLCLVASNSTFIHYSFLVLWGLDSITTWTCWHNHHDITNNAPGWALESRLSCIFY